MASLKQIATEIIDAMGEPFDYMLYTRVKSLIIHNIALVIKIESDKRGIDQAWIQYCKVDMIKTDASGIGGVHSGKTIYRSKNKLPKLARMQHMSPLFYVGNIDRTLTYIYVSDYTKAVRLSNIPSVGRIPKYSIRNGYLECYVRNDNPKAVIVGNAFVDSYAINNESATTPHIDLDENDELLITEDIIQLVKEQLLKGELAMVKPDDNVVNISENEQLRK